MYFNILYLIAEAIGPGAGLQYLALANAREQTSHAQLVLVFEELFASSSLFERHFILSALTCNHKGVPVLLNNIACMKTIQIQNTWFSLLHVIRYQLPYSLSEPACLKDTVTKAHSAVALLPSWARKAARIHKDQAKFLCHMSSKCGIAVGGTMEPMVFTIWFVGPLFQFKSLWCFDGLAFAAAVVPRSALKGLPSLQQGFCSAPNFPELQWAKTFWTGIHLYSGGSIL